MALISCIKWNRNGDHPADHGEIDLGAGYDSYYEYKASPGAVVGRYSDSAVKHPLPNVCPNCGNPSQFHGLLLLRRSADTHPAVVCPGDYIAEDDSGYFLLTPKLKTHG